MQSPISKYNVYPSHTLWTGQYYLFNGITVGLPVEYDAMFRMNGDITYFTPLEIWRRHDVLPDIRAGSGSRNISECLYVNMRTLQGIQKKLDSSHCDFWRRELRHGAYFPYTFKTYVMITLQNIISSSENCHDFSGKRVIPIS